MLTCQLHSRHKCWVGVRQKMRSLAFSDYSKEGCRKRLWSVAQGARCKATSRAEKGCEIELTRWRREQEGGKGW